MVESTAAGVVFHIDRMPVWSLLLANVKNLLDGWDGPVDVEVVANGQAVQSLLQESEARPKIEALAETGVRFLACHNSLRSQGLLEQHLLAQAEVVPAGVVHLARRQLSGWAYLKP
jgi:intracellular sulfur oxidation DsrE/DsrF family protein